VQQETSGNAKFQVVGAYGIPTRHGRDFVGREDVLEQFSQARPIVRASEPCITIIRGIRGQGKTQLALEFCHRALEKNLFSAIFWVDASSEIGVKKCFESFYEKINGNQQDFIEPEAKVEFVRNILSSLETSWLLVFDNYDDPITFNSVRDYFPNNGHGTIILTTCQAEMTGVSDEGRFIELGGLKPADGIALLLQHCQITPTETANQEALMIVEKLEHHALTITQAGTYISSRGIQLNEFLDDFNSRKELILQEGPEISQYRGTLNAAEKDTSLSVFATWELSFEQLEAQDPDGSMARILTLLAFFDCKDISERLLQECCHGRALTAFELEVLGRCVVSLPGKHRNNEAWSAGNEDAEDEGDCQRENNGVVHVWNSLAFGDILNDLRQLSLIQTLDISDDEYHHIAIHPLVNEWIKIRIKDPQAKYNYFLLSVTILHNMVQSISDLENAPETYSRTFSARQIVLANLDTVKRNLEEFLDIQDSTISLHDHAIIEAFGDFAEFLYDTGKFHEALPWQRLAARLWTEMDGKGSDSNLWASNDLAYALLHVGEFDEAIAIAREVIANANNNESFGRRIILTARDVLASCLLYQRKYEEAEALYRSSLENGEDALPRGHVGTLLNNFGFLLYEQGKQVESEQVRSRARDYQLRIFGRHHHLSIEADNNYVMSLQALGRTAEAEEIALDVLERSQTALGPEHPMTFEAIDTLSQVLLAQGKYDDAAALCQQVLYWRIANFGAGHHKTGESRVVMAKIDAARKELKSKL
jgi:tetratricopeptide (TPR) repeat protein